MSSATYRHAADFPVKSKQELIEEIWAASNLTWRQADQIVTEAMTLGMAVYQASRTSSPIPFSQAPEIIRDLAA